MGRMYSCCRERCILSVLLGVFAPGGAYAQANLDMQPSPAADFWQQPTFTGDWGGARDQLAKKGLSLDLNLARFYQGAAIGGASDGYQYGGKLDLYVNADAAKTLGWQGLKLVAHVESRYGEDVNNTDGLLTLGSFNMAFPKAGESSTGLTALKLTQQLGDNFILIASKINTLDDFRLGFTGKNGHDRFFGMTGVSDGNPNSVGWNVTLGTGASGLIPGRKDDAFGAGYFYVATSDHLKGFVVLPPEPPGLAQRNEQGVELYYNAAITRWCNLTLDLQAVEPSTRALETTMVLGARLKFSF